MQKLNSSAKNPAAQCASKAGKLRDAGIDDYGRLHQNELSRLPGVTRLETSFALRDVLEGKS
jgi:hypothetical protein